LPREHLALHPHAGMPMRGRRAFSSTSSSCTRVATARRAGAPADESRDSKTVCCNRRGPSVPPIRCGRCSIGREEVWLSSWLSMRNPGSAPTSDAACTRDATVLAITIARTADRCRRPLAPREPSHPARFA
jgi:hypothetical protein